VMCRVARRLDREEPDDPALADSPPELFAQLQAEAATTWRSPATARRSVRGCDRLHLCATASPCTRARSRPQNRTLSSRGRSGGLESLAAGKCAAARVEDGGVEVQGTGVRSGARAGVAAHAGIGTRAWRVRERCVDDGSVGNGGVERGAGRAGAALTEPAVRAEAAGRAVGRGRAGGAACVGNPAFAAADGEAAGALQAA
jgi:hypothetical protein